MQLPKKADIENKVVVIRLDLNVPIQDRQIAEDTRIVESIPMLKYILEKKPKRLHILTHIGRPKGKKDDKLSTQILIPELEKHLGQKVEFRPDYSSGTGPIQLHENVRFYPGEKNNDPAIIAELMKLKPDTFINDAFAAAHRTHASIVGLADHVPTFGGLLIEKEIQALSPYRGAEKIKGLTLVIGGAKLKTKVPVLQHFAQIADNIIIGGAMANTFLAAQGYDIGASVYEESEIETAQTVMLMMDVNNTGLHMPIDVICADSIDAPFSLDVPVEDVMGGMMILDVGPHSVASYREIIMNSDSIIWNGPLGLFEKPAFAKGTYQILDTITGLTDKTTIIGGGDTLEAMKNKDISHDAFTHVSTGGGAMLEYLAGHDLPGIEILR